MTVLYCAAAVLALIAATFVVFFIVLFRQASAANMPGTHWLDEFSLERYRPLERLFDSADLKFASAQPGYTTALGRQFAASRRTVVRLYLSELSLDFNRLVRLGRHMMAVSNVDRPDLASQLFRQWVRFNVMVLSLRVRLLLAPLGITMRRPAGLFEALVRMRSMVAVLEAPAVA